MAQTPAASKKNHPISNTTKTETVKYPEEPLYHGTYYSVQYEFKNYSFHSSVAQSQSVTAMKYSRE